MPRYGYVYEIRFLGNDGHAYGEWALLRNTFVSRRAAQAAARTAEGCGQSYGAYVAKRRVTLAEKAMARQ